MALTAHGNGQRKILMRQHGIWEGRRHPYALSASHYYFPLLLPDSKIKQLLWLEKTRKITEFNH